MRFLSTSLVSLAVLLPAAAFAEEPRHFYWAEVQRHLIPPPNYSSLLYRLERSVRFDVVVGLNGRVESLTPIEGEMAYAAEIERSLRGIVFKPFTWDGQHVRATFTMTASAPERLGVKAPSLAITNQSAVSFSLDRSACYGTCPEYKVQIGADGTVIFNNAIQPAKVSTRHMKSLLALVRSMDFSSLKDRYIAPVTDNPGSTVTINVDGKNRQITDYVGRAIGMPDTITNLENMIDFVADTSKLLGKSSHNVETLKSQNFDFTSPQGTAALLDAAMAADYDAVIEFEEAGAAFSDNDATRAALRTIASLGKTEIVSHLLDNGVDAGDAQAKTDALASAVEGGHLATAERLIAAGADPRGKDSKTGTPVAFTAAGSGNPELVELILAYHPVLSRMATGHTQDEGSYASPIEWAVLAAQLRADPDQVVTRILKDLVQAGAEPNEPGAQGPPLAEAFDPAIIKTLLNLGADPKLISSTGVAPLDLVPTEALAIRMIEGGADAARPSRLGMTLAERANAYHWWKVLDLIEK